MRRFVYAVGLVKLGFAVEIAAPTSAMTLATICDKFLRAA